MANKSFSFKIGADTSDFIKQMKKADKQINTTEKAAKELEKGLTLKYDETKFVAAQKNMQSALEQTENKASAIRQQLEYLEKTGGIDSASYEKLQNELIKTENKATLLKNELENINKIKYENAAKGVQQVGDALTKAGHAASQLSKVSGALLGSMSAVALNAVKQGDDIQTLATKYGTTAEEIQKLQYVAMQSDVENTTLYKGLKKLNSAVADLAQGEVNNATKALQELGLTAADDFEDVIAAISQLGDVTTQTYYASQIFGDNIASELIPLFQQGEDAIRDYVDEFEAVGYLSNDTVAKLSQFDNVMNNLKAQFKEMALELGVSLLPLMQKFTNWIKEKIIPTIREWSNRFMSLSDSTKEIAAKVLVFATALGPLLTTMGKITNSIGGLIKLIPQIGAGLTSLEAHPIIAIIGVIAILLTVLYTRSEELRGAIDNLVGTLGKSLQPVMEMLTNELNQILDLLMPILDLVASDLADAINMTVEILGPVLEILNEILEVAFELNKWLNPLSWFFGSDGGSYEVATKNVDKAREEISYKTPTVDTSFGTTTNTYNEPETTIDNSVTTNNITIEANEYVTAEEVAKALAIKLQSRS